MPTVFSHIAAPLATRIGAGKELVPAPVLITGLVLSVLPDADVITFRLGIPYAVGLGHRGFSHSLLFAVLAAIAGSLFLKIASIPMRRSFWFLLLAVASHGLLDAFTNGGYGIAFFWPWSGLTPATFSLSR
jgi:inner membrane protein